MKTKYIYASLLAVALPLVGCQDLDTEPEGGIVTDDQKSEIVELNPDRAEAGVNSIFATLSQYEPNASALGASRHNDIGYPSIMLFTDSNTADLVSANNGYNWTGYDLTFEDRDYTMYECQMVWNNLYSIVYAANNVVASYSLDTEDPQEQFYLAQGLAARGYAYWVMAQLYQFNYAGGNGVAAGKDEKCVPLITEKNAEVAAVDGCERSTVAKVYEQIESDLTNAINLLTSAQQSRVTRSDKRYISLAVAYGLRARMYLSKHEYANAASDADDAITAAATEGLAMASLTYPAGPAFCDIDDSNWMWGIVVSESDEVVTSGIVNFPSHMGSLSYGYANYSGGRQISKVLYDEIENTDARKSWWLNERAESDGLSSDEQAYCAAMSYKPYTQVKYAPYNYVLDTSINASDIPMMRVEEMYLIAAEAKAMSSNTSGGLEDLRTFLTARVDNPNLYLNGVSSAEQIQEAVYLQRRIELWGEGLIWFDIMRLNKGIDRRGAGYESEVVYNIPAGDDLLLWRIPESEIQANKALSQADYLPYTAPKAVADN